MSRGGLHHLFATEYAPVNGNCELRMMDGLTIRSSRERRSMWLRTVVWFIRTRRRYRIPSYWWLNLRCSRNNGTPTPQMLRLIRILFNIRSDPSQQRKAARQKTRVRVRIENCSSLDFGRTKRQPLDPDRICKHLTSPRSKLNETNGRYERGFSKIQAGRWGSEPPRERGIMNKTVAYII